MGNETDNVAIVGGGPGESTAAALLARAGRRVVVLERDKFPRFHIGEALLPFCMQAFTRLGLHEKFKRADFDEVLLDHAKNGAEVREPAEALS